MLQPLLLISMTLQTSFFWLYMLWSSVLQPAGRDSKEVMNPHFEGLSNISKTGQKRSWIQSNVGDALSKLSSRDHSIQPLLIVLPFSSKGQPWSGQDDTSQSCCEYTRGRTKWSRHGLEAMGANWDMGGS